MRFRDALYRQRASVVGGEKEEEKKSREVLLKAGGAGANSPDSSEGSSYEMVAGRCVCSLSLVR